MLTTHHKLGHFDRRITIQSKTVTTSATGAKSTEWPDFLSRKAKYDLKGSQSKFEASQEVARTVRLYVIRYDSETKAIDATMRILDDDDYWYIEGVEKLTRERIIYLTAVNRK